MGNHATAPVDDHGLAVDADTAVVGEALDFRQVDGPGEKPDQVALGVEDRDGDDDGGHAGVPLGPDHVGVRGANATRAEHLLDVVPDAIVRADRGGWRRRHRPAVQAADIELEQGRLRRVGGRQLLVEVGGIEARFVQARQAGVVGFELRCRALQCRRLVEQVAVDRLRQAFRHRFVFLLDAGVLGGKQR